MQDDPNYKEVSIDVDMYVDKSLYPQPISFIRKIINKILLVIRSIWNRIVGKKEKVYKPEPVDLKYVHIGDLTEEKLKEMARKPSEEICYSSLDASKSLGKFYDQAASKEEGIVCPNNIRSVPSTYIVRNRITGSVMITKGTLDGLKSQYNNDYEIVEPVIKD